MNITSPSPAVAMIETQVAPILRSGDPSSAHGLGRDLSNRKSFNVCRPWNFPAARVDSFIRRRYLRARVQVPVEVSLSRLDGSLYDMGTGVVRDVSYSGLCLDHVILSNGHLLAAYFAVELRPTTGPTGSSPIAGRILHTYTSELPCFGIEFLHPEAGAEGLVQSWR